MTDRNSILADVRANTEQSIETCRLVIDRVVDAYCIADPGNGQMLFRDGIHPLYKTIGDVERSRDKSKVIALLEEIRKMNPDNPVVQRLRVMGFKKAARLQLEINEDLLQRIGS